VGHATRQKLWPEANAQLGARPRMGWCDAAKGSQRLPPLGVGVRTLKVAIGLADSSALFETCGPRIILQTPVWGALRGWASRPSGEFRC
jgi:hypothetical protein